MPKTYSWAHRTLRKQLAAQVEAGMTVCVRCKKPIAAGEPWDLGHDDERPWVWAGPEHRACNRATQTAGRATARPPRQSRRIASRRW